jgi:hypothetical protein
VVTGSIIDATIIRDAQNVTLLFLVMEIPFPDTKLGRHVVLAGLPNKPQKQTRFGEGCFSNSALRYQIILIRW